MASLRGLEPALAGISVARAGLLCPDARDLWLWHRRVGVGWTFKARVITGRSLCPLRSHSQGNLPSPDLVSSPGKMKPRTGLAGEVGGQERSQYRAIPGLIRATELFHSESGFCKGALWGGIGEKMNFQFSRASVENHSDSTLLVPAFQVLAVSAHFGGCHLRIWFPHLLWHATHQKGTRIFCQTTWWGAALR